MKNFTIYYYGTREYIADSEKEAKDMFKHDCFSGSTMEIDDIMEEEIEENDK